MTLRDDQKQKTIDAKSQFKMRLVILGLGCALLAFLVAVDHEKWFELRPASGTAAAMYHAKQPPVPTSDAVTP